MHCSLTRALVAIALLTLAWIFSDALFALLDWACEYFFGGLAVLFWWFIGVTA